VKIPFKVLKCCAGGIHSMLINDNNEAMSFGCGSDGRIGHEESKDHRYLYR
jgi:alpha-tubulin suppressor-like RCC1 family protein